MHISLPSVSEYILLVLTETEMYLEIMYQEYCFIHTKSVRG